jgi:hypothetical protein
MTTQGAQRPWRDDQGQDHISVLDPRFPIRLSMPESLFWELVALRPDRACADAQVYRARAQAARYEERFVTRVPVMCAECAAGYCGAAVCIPGGPCTCLCSTWARRPPAEPPPRRPLAELWHEPDGALDDAFDTFARASEEGQDTQTIVSLAGDIVAARPGRRMRRAIARWIGGT